MKAKQALDLLHLCLANQKASIEQLRNEIALTNEFSSLKREIR